jgi:hypothetical protein
MTEFIWRESNENKVLAHYLTTEEVEFAWGNSIVVDDRGVHPIHGPYLESIGVCPSGKPIMIIWRYNVDWDGEERVFVITAY